MNTLRLPGAELGPPAPPSLLDVFIRAGIILALAMLCYRVFSPFLTLMVWALILAVALYPLHQLVAAKIGNRQGLAATLLGTVRLILLAAPNAVLRDSLGACKRY